MKKLMRKLLAVVAALTMVLGMSGLTAFAATNLTITIDNAVNGEKYQLYKVFDAKVVDGRATNDANGIRYTVPDRKTLDANNGWFSVDKAGNVTAKDGAEAALSSDDFKNWVKTFGTPVGAAKTAADGKVEWVGLSDGYYYITTTTGSLVTVTSIAPNAIVKEKNTVSAVDDKTATLVENSRGSVNTKNNDTKTAGHLVVAEVGSTVDFTATVNLGKGAKNVKFHDTMSDGLKLVADSIQVTGLLEGVTAQTLTTPEETDTFTIQFNGNVSEDAKVTITYKATVTSDALTKDAATNKAHITYGEQNTTTQEKEVDVYNAKITVDKTIAGLTGEQKLDEGDEAQFVLTRKNADGTTQYYKYTAATIDPAADAKVEWVTDVKDATKLSFNSAHDTRAFTGLANGEYTVVESNVPKGYLKAEDKTFTIKDADTTIQSDREQTDTVTNKKGSALPSTGGMGTTIFYVLGAALVIGAGVVLVTRRRLSK